MLAEVATLLADRPDAVSDAIWNEAAKKFEEKGLPVTLLMIAPTNLFIRLNAITKEQAGATLELNGLNPGSDNRD
ncbi:hypothetical protein [Ktedonospora formicarum]|uniref:Uncharacterized protein n=1 Tax=Ktedonospora formicarum TaxID=2778364 RepID=A0A8J3I5J5_9CHLR|nr:hypothetical protein [Ktedonospora formicarum]GHO45769.1 hypothetical protein KSX_39320 [Ktedonospora formicarum]